MNVSYDEPCDCSCHTWNCGDGKPVFMDLDPGDPERGPNPCIVVCCECHENTE